MPLFLHERLHFIPQCFHYLEFYVHYSLDLKEIVLIHIYISQNAELLFLDFKIYKNGIMSNKVL